MTNIESKLIKPKLGVLELAKQLGSVSAACKPFLRGPRFQGFQAFFMVSSSLRNQIDRTPPLETTMPALQQFLGDTQLAQGRIYQSQAQSPRVRH